MLINLEDLQNLEKLQVRKCEVLKVHCKSFWIEQAVSLWACHTIALSFISDTSGFIWGLFTNTCWGPEAKKGVIKIFHPGGGGALKKNYHKYSSIN